MTRLIPIVALIDEDDLAVLQPTIDELAKRLEPHCSGLGWQINGWTPEMLAWSRVLRAVASEDLEIVVGASS